MQPKADNLLAEPDRRMRSDVAQNYGFWGFNPFALNIWSKPYIFGGTREKR
jgi:hypothetical protein